MDFINRTTELQALARCLDRTPAFFVLYGRRRIGKSALLRETCRDRRHVFLTADLGTPEDHLRAFSSALARGLGEPIWTDLQFSNWEKALRICIEKAEEEPLVLVLDEFQHLVIAHPPLASILQRLWDHEIQESRLSLVICGSYVSFMERKVLGVRNPLYGRRTGQLRLRLLAARHAGLFYPDWTAADRMNAVGVLGGVPAYLRLFRQDRDLRNNLFQALLDPGSPLFEEPRFLMMEEVREPQAYFSACRAMAHGRSTPNEIANSAGLPYNAMSPLLSTLRGLSLVERRVPATVKNPERTRRSQYRLHDAFLRFWFRFVLPNRTQLEAGEVEAVWHRRIEPQLAQHVSMAFEDACAEYLYKLHRQGDLPAEYDRIGPWWHKQEEVDVVAVADDGPLLMAECKWSTNPVGLDVLESLVAKTPRVAQDLPSPPTRVDYALFSRVGFTDELREEAESRGVLLATVEEVMATT